MGQRYHDLTPTFLITSEGSVNRDRTGYHYFECEWDWVHSLPLALFRILKKANTFVSEPIEYLALMYAHDASGPFAFSARQPSSEAFVVESGDSNSLVAGGAVNLNVLLFCGGSVSNGIGVVGTSGVMFHLEGTSNLGTAFFWNFRSSPLELRVLMLHRIYLDLVLRVRFGERSFFVDLHDRE